ncbi:MAG: radical SAM/SPASM domain-containing protein [bacterium]
MELTRPETYEKHHSFELFYSRNGSVRTQTERALQVVTGDLESVRLNGQAEVIASVRESLSKQSQDDEAEFQLTPFIADEMSRLEDQELITYLFHRFRYDVYPGQHLLDEYPPYLQIEPTSICNFRCVFCYQTDKRFTTKSSGYMGAMSFELYKEIVDQVEGKIHFLSLASRGEPLLCKDIDKMLEYSIGKFLGLKLNTNGSVLTEPHIHAILSGGVNTLVISADAADEESYARLRVNGKLDKILKNLENFNTIKEKQYPDAKIITRVSGVMVSEAQNMAEMKQRWGALVDQISFVKYNPWESIYASEPNALTTPCSDLWRRMFIWYDGKVNPCDSDYKSTLAVGDVRKSTISEIWRSEGYRALREHHRNARRCAVEPCRRCVVI